MNNVFQITLKSIKVIENGTIEENADGVNILTATLNFPNEQVRASTSMRSLELKDADTVDFTQKDFLDQLLFKERIFGECMMSVELTAVEKVSKFDKILTKILGKVVTTALGAISGVGAIVTAALTTASGAFFESFDTEDKVTIIGRGAMPLSAVNKQGELSINLTIPKEVMLASSPFIDENDNEVIRQIRLKKGFVNAQVVFQLLDLGPVPVPAPMPIAGLVGTNLA
jgi:hypothetical protein